MRIGVAEGPKSMGTAESSRTGSGYRTAWHPGRPGASDGRLSGKIENPRQMTGKRVPQTMILSTTRTREAGAPDQDQGTHRDRTMPASERKLAANRLNALKSTGPRTDEGKEVSRANAYKHGMTAVVVIPGEDAGEAARRSDALACQIAPDGNELGTILAKHVALLSLQVERCARHAAVMAAERSRTATVDEVDARLARAETLLTHIGAEWPTNHRRMLDLPEGVDLLIDRIGQLRQTAALGPANWDGSLASAFDHLTGRPFYLPLTRMSALTNILDRDDARALDPAEVPADKADRRTWAAAEVLKLIDAELERLRSRRAALDAAPTPVAILPDGTSITITPADRAAIASDPATLLARKYQFAAVRAMHRTLQEIRHHRREQARPADAAIKAALKVRTTQEAPDARALPPITVTVPADNTAALAAALGSFLHDDQLPIPARDASMITIGKAPVDPPSRPRRPRLRP